MTQTQNYYKTVFKNLATKSLVFWLSSAITVSGLAATVAVTVYKCPIGSYLNQNYELEVFQECIITEGFTVKELKGRLINLGKNISTQGILYQNEKLVFPDGKTLDLKDIQLKDSKINDLAITDDKIVIAKTGGETNSGITLQDLNQAINNTNLNPTGQTQTLSISGDTLAISNGDFVRLPTSAQNFVTNIQNNTSQASANLFSSINSSSIISSIASSQSSAVSQLSNNNQVVLIVGGGNNAVSSSITSQSSVITNSSVSSQIPLTIGGFNVSTNSSGLPVNINANETLNINAGNNLKSAIDTATKKITLAVVDTPTFIDLTVTGNANFNGNISFGQLNNSTPISNANNFLGFDNSGNLVKVAPAIGLQGIQGLQGIAGPSGANGLQGITGANGIQGLQGIQGEIGLTGLTGLTGAVGVQGVQGFAGGIGLTGSQGIQGVKGDTGDQGIQGVTGLQGEIGLTGASGLQGIQGISGVANIQTANNGLTLAGGNLQLGGALTSPTTITTTGVNTLSVTGLNTGSVSDRLLVQDPTTGELKNINSSVLASPITIYGINSLFSTGLAEPAGVGAFNTYESIFLGSNAGSGATYADYSIFLGLNAGQNAPFAFNSNFFGGDAGNGADNAESSNFIGYGAGGQAKEASGSNFLGVYAGKYATNAPYSNFIGTYAGEFATNANNSNFFGRSTGEFATNANNSTFIGDSAGYNATNANNSTFIGRLTGQNAINANNSLFLGRQAGYLDTVNNSTGGTSILIGDNTNTGGFSNSIALGRLAENTKSNQFKIAPAYNNLSIGGVEYVVPNAQATAAGQVLTNNGIGTLSWANAGSNCTTADFNLCFGLGALSSSPIGQYNTGMGLESLKSNLDGYENTAVGYRSLFSNSSGTRNTAIGNNSSLLNINGILNSSFGHNSLTNNINGEANSAFGAFTLQRSTGSLNTAFGENSFGSLSSGSGNTSIGMASGLLTNSGSNNVFIGLNSGSIFNSGSGNVGLGANTQFANNNGSNQLNIANNIFGTGLIGSIGSPAGFIGLGITAPTEKLDIAGNLRLSGAFMPNNISGTTGQVLTSQGSGIAPIWTNLPSTQGSQGTQTASNGLTLTGSNLALGGILTSPTNVTTSAVNTLSLTGLQVGSATDNLLVQDANGILKTLNSSLIGKDSLQSAYDFTGNGTGNTINLFDSKPININSTSNFFNFSTTALELKNFDTSYQSGTNLAFNGSYNTYVIESSKSLTIRPQDLLSLTSGSTIINTVTGTRITDGTNNSSGLFFEGLTNSTPASTATNYLGYDGTGKVVKVATPSGGPCSTCFTNGGNSFGGLTSIGTNDNQDLIFKRNNIKSGQISQDNTSFGINTFANNTFGSQNTAIGILALFNNTNGSSNTANGAYALYANTIGGSNTATGYNSLINNIAGNSNTANGSNSLQTNTSGSQNTAFGGGSLFSNKTGSQNTAIGYQALSYNTTGFFNTAIGYKALEDNTLARSNTAIGTYAGRGLTTGENNTFIGDSTVIPTGITTGIANTIIGSSISGLNPNLSNNIILADGQGNQRINVIANGNVGLGITSPTNKLTVQDLTTTSVAKFNGSASTQCTVVTGTGLSCSSDQRLKQGITSLGNATDIIKGLRPVTYQWNGGSETQYGLIAQEVQTILPDLVTTNSDGYLSLSQQELMPFVIKALQETNAKVDANSQGTNITTTINTFTQPNIFSQVLTAAQDLIVRGVSYLQDLVVKGSTIFQGRVEFQDKDMAGVATIRPNTKEIEVRYTKPYNFTPVVNITSLGHRIIGNLKSSNPNGFVIEIENPALTNLKFNWTAINVQGEELISTSSMIAVSSSSSATSSSSSSSSTSISSLPEIQSSSIAAISSSSSVENISSNVSSSSSI